MIWAVAALALQVITTRDSVAGRFAEMARHAPRGAYPRYLHGEQPYWTVFGSRGGGRTGLLDTDGNADFGANTPGIAPFVLDAAGHVTSWADVRAEASLDGGDRPIPSVTWHTADWSLMITGFGVHDSLGLRYRVENTSARGITLTLMLAERPFQVDPPWQSLNVAGGPTTIRAINPMALHPSQRPTAVGATPFAKGDITKYIWRDTLPRDTAVRDPDGYASAAMAFRMVLGPGQHRDVYLGSQDLDGARAEWTNHLILRGSPLVDTLAQAIHASVGYIS